MNEFFEKHQQNSDLEKRGSQVCASSGMNDSGTCQKIGTQLTQVRSGLVHDLDCALRRSSDETRRMQLGLRMGMEREGSTPAFKARQDAILKPRIRVAAKMEVAL
jgi:hypothetical protein